MWYNKYSDLTEECAFANISNNCYKPYIEKDNRSIHVLWSGGCDSTLIMWKLVNHLKNEAYAVINSYSVFCKQVGEVKMDLEKQKREEFIKLVDTMGYKVKIEHKEIIVSDLTIHHQKCGQAALWLSSVIPYLPDKSILYAGYHKGDDFLTYDIFKDWLKSFVGLLNLYGKQVDFCMPFKYNSKLHIIRELKSVPGLYEATWWCECPTWQNKACGHCVPCETHDMALAYIEMMNKREPEIVHLVETKDHTECVKAETVEKIDTEISGLMKSLEKELTSDNKVLDSTPIEQ